MADREEGLTALRAQVGGIDPVLDNAADYARAVKETQKTVRQQGQVMQATLQNNHVLYHTNKKLVPENRMLRGRIKELETREQQLLVRIQELEETLSEGGGGGDRRYKALWSKAMKTLNAYHYDLLDHDQLKQRLEEMKAQAAEIEAMPEHATPIEIARGEYADPYNPEAQEQAYRERLAEHNKRHAEATEKVFGKD